MALRQVTDATFEKDVLEAPGLILVHFWAPWAKLSRDMNRLLELVARRYGPRLGIVGLEIDGNPQMRERFRVMSIPTYLFFRSGQVVETRVGRMEMFRLYDIIDALL